MNKYVLLNVHAVNDVRQMEICVHTTELQVPYPLRFIWVLKSREDVNHQEFGASKEVERTF
jgi:hypothetical protein